MGRLWGGARCADYLVAIPECSPPCATLRVACLPCPLRLTPLLHRPLSEPLQVVQSRQLSGPRSPEHELMGPAERRSGVKKERSNRPRGAPRRSKRAKDDSTIFVRGGVVQGGHFSAASIVNGIGNHILFANPAYWAPTVAPGPRPSVVTARVACGGREF